ncbi:MAG TPA: cellulose synthase operon protein YhjQ/BcsQ [Longimicrobiaceae bacterium]|nr:cellulose synthase operon protein YhjQ/BcsQ [Longimicrobiaceae bacterium]
MSTQVESLRRFVAQNPAPHLPAPTGGSVVVGGGKGGVGTSTVAALLAVGAATTGATVLLVDADAGFGALHLLLGAPAGPGLEALRSGGTSPDELIVAVTSTLSLLPGGSGSSASAAERQSLLRRASIVFPRFDLVVVDGGSRLDSVLAACAAGAARALCVAVDDRIALTATYALTKVLAERFPGLPTEVIVNRADHESAEFAAGQVGAAARHFLHRSVGFAGAVPEDDSLRIAVDAGMHLQDAAAGSPAAATLEVIGSTLLHQPTAGPQLVERRHLHRRP